MCFGQKGTTTVTKLKNQHKKHKTLPEQGIELGPSRMRYLYTAETIESIDCCQAI